MSPFGQRTLAEVESALRPLVGYSEKLSAGYSKGLHSHPRAQVLHVVRGLMQVRVDDITYVILPSTALFLPTGVAHEVTFRTTAELNTLFLRESATVRLAAAPKVITITPLLRELIAAASAEPLDWDLSGRGRHIAELAIDEIANSTELNFMIRLPSDKRVSKITQALLQSPSDDQDIEHWASVANVASRTLTRIFQRETGMSFIQWRQQIRLIRALEALASGASPKEAAAVGCYESNSAFGVSFKRTFGVTPGEARSGFGNNSICRTIDKGDVGALNEVSEPRGTTHFG
jgi:AraC-like DNA-binding protein